jgi:hypothetical protein
MTETVYTPNTSDKNRRNIGKSQSNDGNAALTGGKKSRCALFSKYHSNSSSDSSQGISRAYQYATHRGAQRLF